MAKEKTCELCGKRFPQRQLVDGVYKNLQRRKYCFECSPFGSGNTRKLDGSSEEELVEKKKAADKEKYRKWQDKARLERKAKLVEMLGGKCQRCGYDKCLAALSFHHRDPTEKKFALSVKGLCHKWDDIVEEAKKCDLLCMNCHAEEHNERMIKKA